MSERPAGGCLRPLAVVIASPLVALVLLFTVLGDHSDCYSDSGTTFGLLLDLVLLSAAVSGLLALAAVVYLASRRRYGKVASRLAVAVVLFVGVAATAVVYNAQRGGSYYECQRVSVPIPEG